MFSCYCISCLNCTDGSFWDYKSTFPPDGKVCNDCAFFDENIDPENEEAEAEAIKRLESDCKKLEFREKELRANHKKIAGKPLCPKCSVMPGYLKENGEYNEEKPTNVLDSTETKEHERKSWKIQASNKRGRRGRGETPS